MLPYNWFRKLFSRKVSTIRNGRRKETGRDKDSRTTNAVPVEAVMVGLVGYVYKELDNVIERRRLMASVQNAGPSPFRP